MRYLVILAMAFTLGACQQSGSKKSKDMKDSKAKAEKSMSKSKSKEMTAKAEGDGVKCSGFGVNREIAIVKSAEGCTVQYTKDGNMKEVANGSVGSDHCMNVAKQIQTKLESNGFKCQ